MFWFSNKRRKVRFIFRRGRRRFRQREKSASAMDETPPNTSKENNKNKKSIQEVWLRLQKKHNNNDDVLQTTTTTIAPSSFTETSNNCIWMEASRTPSSSSSSASSSSTTDDESFSTAYSFEELEDAGIIVSGVIEEVPSSSSSSSSSSCCGGSVNSKKSVKFLLPERKGGYHPRSMPIRTPAKTCHTLLHGDIPLAKIVVDPSETTTSCFQYSKGMAGGRLHIVGCLPRPAALDEDDTKNNNDNKNEDSDESRFSGEHDSNDNGKEDNVKEENVKWNECPNGNGPSETKVKAPGLPGTMDQSPYQAHTFAAPADDVSIEVVLFDFSRPKIATNTIEENIKGAKEIVKAFYHEQECDDKDMPTLGAVPHDDSDDMDQPSLTEVSFDGCTDDSSCDEIFPQSLSNVALRPHKNSFKFLAKTNKDQLAAHNLFFVFNVLLLMALQASLLKIVAADRLKHEA